MDHEFAERTHAVERYLLDEFTPEERHEFEEHLFDCLACGDQVRQNAIAVDNLKEVLRTERLQSADNPQAKAVPRLRRIREWLRPAVLVPLTAALCLAAALVYQSFVYIPSLEEPQVLSTMVIAPLARDGGPVVAVDPHLARFNLNFEVDSPQPYSAYLCDFERQGGGGAVRVVAPAENSLASFTLSVLLPTKRFSPGHYTMILRPASQPQTEIQRYSFTIQDQDVTK